MALVLGATGVFVHARLQAGLDRTINAGLRSRADDVAALVQQADSGLSEGYSSVLAERGESFAQVLDRNGSVMDTTPQLGRKPLLAGAALANALRHTSLLVHAPIGVVDNRSRILATPVLAQDQRVVVIVGTSLESRDEALRQLTTQLLIGGPVTLLLAALAGYGLAGAALRPVEAMRARAALISGTDHGARLPVPPADDEIRRLGETLNDMLARLESALDRERSFVADASHELRTPLALLKTELELALRHPRSAAELENAVRSAADETDRLTQLAEDLLVLARADQGRLPVRRDRVRASAVLDGAAERFARRAQQSGRQIVVSAPTELEVSGDPLRLEQALGNLIENALRHGRGAIQLVAVARADGTVELHVLDEGPGFPESFLGQAFDRFSRGGNARGSGGTGAGLGLAIVDGIAPGHGGSAHAGNRPAGGADVWLSIAAPGR